MSEQVDEKGEEDDRPWDQPWGFRRDSVPHRGHQLVTAAKIGAALHVCSLICFPLIVIAVPWSLICFARARDDLEEIASGYRDRRGESPTRQAEKIAIRGLFCGTVACLLWGGLLIFCCGFPSSP